MKTTTVTKAEPRKLDLSVKSAGALTRAFVTPGMMFTKA
jgi:hypothetical protein